MNVLALVGSHRKKGNTARFVQMVEAEMEARAVLQGEALDFETLYMGHMDIEMCRGCRTCFDRGEEKCPLKDDVPSIRAKIDAADGIVLASPVYVNDVSGIVKNWIDRLAYVCHRPAFAGTCAYLVATVADSPTSHTLRTMDIALRTWGVHIVGQAGYKMGALMAQEEMEACYRGEAKKVAAALFDAIAQKRFLHPSFLSLMMFKIQQQAWQEKAEPDSYDYAYWKGRGWFEPGKTFFIEHRVNPVKVTLARLVGAVVSRFVA